MEECVQSDNVGKLRPQIGKDLESIPRINLLEICIREICQTLLCD